MSEPLLRLERLTKRFGGLIALEEVDLVLDPGAIHALIGPNGAGKSTLFNCASGNSAPDQGRVVLRGEDLTGRLPHVFADRRLQRTYQHTRPFSGLTLAENVMVGAHAWTSAGPLRGALRWPSARREERELRELAVELLGAVGLGGREEDEVAALSLAEERRLELARCLAGRPAVMLLDEPAAGFGERDAEELSTLIRTFRDERGIGVVLVEHHLEMALALADVVTVLDFGRVIAHGGSDEVRRHPDVVRAYIGSDA
jgi:branched-chain amino acid transport system ATP-binding protein